MLTRSTVARVEPRGIGMRNFTRPLFAAILTVAVTPLLAADFGQLTTTDAKAAPKATSRADVTADLAGQKAFRITDELRSYFFNALAAAPPPPSGGATCTITCSSGEVGAITCGTGVQCYCGCPGTWAVCGCK
jgi:hypothetical protein